MAELKSNVSDGALLLALSNTAGDVKIVTLGSNESSVASIKACGIRKNRQGAVTMVPVPFLNCVALAYATNDGHAICRVIGQEKSGMTWPEDLELTLSERQHHHYRPILTALPNGALCIAFAGYPQILVMDIVSREIAARLTLQQQQLTHVACVGHEHLATCSLTGVTIWNPMNATVAYKLALQPHQHLSMVHFWTPSKMVIATMPADTDLGQSKRIPTQLQVHQINDRNVAKESKGMQFDSQHDDLVLAVCTCFDGRLATGSRAGELKLWKPDGKCDGTLTFSDTVELLCPLTPSASSGSIGSAGLAVNIAHSLDIHIIETPLLEKMTLRTKISLPPTLQRTSTAVISALMPLPHGRFAALNDRWLRIYDSTTARCEYTVSAVNDNSLHQVSLLGFGRPEFTYLVSELASIPELTHVPVDLLALILQYVVAACI